MDRSSTSRTHRRFRRRTQVQQRLSGQPGIRFIIMACNGRTLGGLPWGLRLRSAEANLIRIRGAAVRVHQVGAIVWLGLYGRRTASRGDGTRDRRHGRGRPTTNRWISQTFLFRRQQLLSVFVNDFLQVFQSGSASLCGCFLSQVQRLCRRNQGGPSSLVRRSSSVGATTSLGSRRCGLGLVRW